MANLYLLLPQNTTTVSRSARRNPSIVRCHKSGHSRLYGADDQHDGLILARSDAPLPTDRAPSIQRWPSLEREDAFYDAKTSKPKVHVGRRLVVPDAVASCDDDDAQIAHLYNMGLLYDDADRSGDASHAADLRLDDIRHDEPIYPIRQARRRHRSTAKARGYSGPLPLNLSFADLGNDDDLARYIRSSSPSPSPLPSGDSTDHQQRTSSSSGTGTGGRSGQTSPPLRVIYELATARPSYDVDTSQTPDLMDDCLSDYDCFSDVDTDAGAAGRGLAQTEVRDTHTSDSWVLLGDDS
ncbi:hypothetical protein GMORB2_4851 [Geosmithia morbida]|uniref:Uncharacterized protein n=1 Tax=Geosmithia morbida TaxID=1094350 RepID=A0A9P4YPB2_9HYPO|nr:uncharacterized protein GMORB2_4851 [Geosmithia morbida]KAF4119332.1 hypothetical protein GMORB2_4851 [Geosmithia morbida]